MLPSNNIIGKNRLHFETITSTNDFAIEWASKTNPIEGSVVSADFQSSGKGQYGRVWQGMAHKNIALSIVLYPLFLAPKEQYYLSKAVSLGVYDFFISLGMQNVSIKWPNDLYIDDDKICGILIQNVLTSSVYKLAIVGIGINVFQEEFDPDIPNASSLFLKGLDRQKSIRQLEDLLFEHMDRAYAHIVDKKFEFIDTMYNDLLWNKSQNINYEVLETGKTYLGKIIDVTSQGQLRIENELKQLDTYQHGSIKFLK